METTDISCGTCNKVGKFLSLQILVDLKSPIKNAKLFSIPIPYKSAQE